MNVAITKIKRATLSTAIAALFASGLAVAAQNQEANPGTGTMQHHNSAEIVQTVRATSRQYRDMSIAIEDGYELATGCVSGSGGGAMGVHYARFDLIGDGILDASTPELLVYEPNRFGNMDLVAVEFLTVKDAWEANNGEGVPPILDGQHTMLVNAPNRYALPSFYMLHVWAFKPNKSGMFAAYNPRATCKHYQS